jgi:hypothetical protein
LIVGIKTPDPGHNSCLPLPPSKCDEGEDGVSLTAGGGNVVALAALVFVTLVFAGAYKF